MGIKKHGGSIEILTSSLPVSIPIRIPPSYDHLGQQIDLPRETEFDSSYHHLKKLSLHRSGHIHPIWSPFVSWYTALFSISTSKSNQKNDYKKRIEKECDKKIFRTKNRALLARSKKSPENLSFENAKRKGTSFNLKLKETKIYTIMLY